MSPSCYSVQIYFHPFSWASTQSIQPGDPCLSIWEMYHFWKRIEILPRSLCFPSGASIIPVLDLQNLCCTFSCLSVFQFYFRSWKSIFNSIFQLLYLICHCWYTYYFQEILLLLFSELFNHLLFICHRCHIFSYSLRILWIFFKFSVPYIFHVYSQFVSYIWVFVCNLPGFS